MSSKKSASNRFGFILVNNMNKIWIISDTHFGHFKMTEYCGRPYNLSFILLANIKSIVQPGDTLIHLGDFCIGKDKDWAEQYRNATVGVNKILILGNHDKQTPNWYLSNGFNSVCEQMSGHYYGKFVTFSHRPIPNVQNINIHGHMHNHLPRLLRKEWAVPDEEERNREDLAGLNGNHKLVSMELEGYLPIPLDKFLERK